MHPSRTRLLVPAAIAIALVVLPSIWLARQFHQQHLNRDLIAAIKASDPQKVEALLAAGADPNTRVTPEQHEPLLQRLKHLFRPTTPLGSTTIITALSTVLSPDGDSITYPPQTTAIIEELLARGASPDEHDSNGFTPLDWLQAYTEPGLPQKSEILTHLIAAGANIDSFGTLGGNHLMDACFHDQPDIVRLLLDHGANPNLSLITDGWIFFQSPLSWARHKHLTKIIAILKAHGAND